MSRLSDVFLIVLSYAAIGTLLIVLLVRTGIPRRLAATAVMAMSAFYIATFYWVTGLLGWPAPLAVPDRFKVVATRVVEPDLRHQRPGAVHVWLEELDDRNLPSGEPRAYVLPYSTDLAARVSAAQSELNKGNAQGGTSRALASGFGNGAPEGANVRTIAHGAAAGGDPSGGGVLDPAAIGGQSKFIDLIPLPPPLLPPKDDP